MAKQKVTPGLALRQEAAQRLGSVLKGASFAPFSVSEIGDGRDRGLANKLVTTALRRHGHLDRVLAYLLERGVPKKSGDFEAILRLSLAQILYLPDLGDHSALFLAGEAMKADTRTQHLAGLTNAVLRRAQKEASALREAPLALLFPDRLVRKWTKSYGSEMVEAFGAALLEGAPLDLTLRDNDPELIAALGGVPLAADSVRVTERDSSVEQMPGYAEGRFWVQDFAATIPARLIDAPVGARVLDLCAAPGGKTAQLIKAGYKVTALDNEPSRMVRLHANLQRLGYRAGLVTADGLTYGTDDPFDAVLLDAPCSATGTFRRHPEVVWHRDAADIAGRVALQRGFIERAALLLKPGGTLVYCVCSLEDEEGEQQVEWIGRSGLGLEPSPISANELSGWPAPLTPAGHVRTHPGLALPEGIGGRLDGFFVARFHKR